MALSEKQAKYLEYEIEAAKKAEKMRADEKCWGMAQMWKERAHTLQDVLSQLRRIE